MKISGADTSQDVSCAIQPPVNCIGIQGADMGGAPSELCTEGTDSDIHSEIDESELGEFLLDTFDGMESHGNLLAQIEMPV